MSIVVIILSIAAIKGNLRKNLWGLAVPERQCIMAGRGMVARCMQVTGTRSQEITSWTINTKERERTRSLGQGCKLSKPISSDIPPPAGCHSQRFHKILQTGDRVLNYLSLWQTLVMEITMNINRKKFAEATKKMQITHEHMESILNSVKISTIIKHIFSLSND